MEDWNRGDSSLSETITVCWIDDDLEHREDVKNIEHKNKKLQISFFHPNDFLDKLGDGFGKNIPDLFLIDYYLDRKGDGNKDKYEYKGLTLAGTIRETFPNHPIYAMTNDLAKKTGPFASRSYATQSLFDDIYEYNTLQAQGHNILYYDAVDYKILRDTRKNSVKALFQTLNAPEHQYEMLELILPNELQSGLGTNQSGNCIAYARWIKNELMRYPGFLYDVNYNANYLGTTPEVFDAKLSSKFKNVRYTGVFSNSQKTLWWVSEIDKKLFSYKKAKGMSSVNAWEVAPKIFNLSQKELSKCGICGKIFPETIGVNVNNPEDIRPIHISCSEPHPKIRPRLYYDEIRAFKTKGK